MKGIFKNLEIQDEDFWGPTKERKVCLKKLFGNFKFSQLIFFMSQNRSPHLLIVLWQIIEPSFFFTPSKSNLNWKRYSDGQKKASQKKGYFRVQKMLYIFIFFSFLNMKVCYLKLLKLEDWLWLSVLRNFFSAGKSIFSCECFSYFIQCIWSFRNQFKILVGGWVVGLEELTMNLSQLSTKFKLKLRVSLATSWRFLIGFWTSRYTE